MSESPKSLNLWLVGATLGLTVLLGGVLYYKVRSETAYTFRPVSQTNLVLLAQTLKKDFSLETSAASHTIPAAVLAGWFERYYRYYTGQRELRPNTEKIKVYLDQLAKQTDKSATNAWLNIDSMGQLVEVAPAVAGQKMNVEKTLTGILFALNHGQNSTTLITEPILPTVTLEKAQQLGIRDRLGVGESNFAGSPTSRAHNIRVGAKIFNGLIVEAGKEFSFNQLLGPVEAATGFKPELVIKTKKIVPEYGGGLCQVSTTVFRAVMAAGLPILERHPHSLPVRYYNPQGFDATIYPGVSDFRFKNDTANPILIQTAVLGSSISFQIFGQSDGRQTKIDGPQIYESNPDGSLRAWIKRVVTLRDGSERKDTFYSNYKSPALFPIIRDPLE